MNFKTDIEPKYIYLYSAPMELATTMPDDDPELVYDKAIVSWCADLDARSWGIKSFIKWVSHIDITIGDDDLRFEDGVDGWKIAIEDDCKYDQIVPASIDIDWERKEIEVRFV